MVHHGQGLALGLEPRHDGPGIHAQFDDLEGDSTPNRLGVLGHIDHPTPALTDFLHQLVAVDPLARHFVRGV